ncbi:endonuclease [Microbulbifer thermotolerans]|uniref:endonuclease n=1 Tax=Microbulbifer thermotolerans TaxID=252514 RepID=UPI00224A53F9|nr:endonuclease [Microbulbifer thermotolerans]MCX2834439.1 endonuclease [Microbulbifer thermotolerans]
MKPFTYSFINLLVVSLFSSLSFAHGGALDAKGCHHDRKSGEYHCHRSQANSTSVAASTSPASTANAPNSSSSALAHRIRNFRDAKNVLRDKIYSTPEQQVAFYSGCRYHRQGKKLVPDWNTCGFKPRKNANRASRIEWEHIVPAWVIGHQRQCWQNGGRSNCTRNDADFAMAEADLHNLVPAIGEINGDRSNFRFAELGGEFQQYGAVPMKVDFKQRAVQPPNAVKGNIARTYFYMVETYNLNLSKAQRRLFEAWAKADPVDAWECQRNKKIAQIQGNPNPYVSQGCLSAGLG